MSTEPENVLPISDSNDKVRLDHAFSQLFQSLAIIAEEAKKPGFNRMCFVDDKDGRKWSIPALIGMIDRKLNVIRKEGTNPL